MTPADSLARRYRNWLKWYPTSFRREYEAELLGVLLTGAREGQRRPDPMDVLDLLTSGLHLRVQAARCWLAPPAFRAARMMWMGALLELASATTIVMTAGDVRSSLVRQGRLSSDAQWQAVFATQLEPVALAACVAAGIWLVLALAIGRGHGWARIAFAVLFGANLLGLGNGLAQGSAVNAAADLALGTAVCLAHLTALVLVFHDRAGPSPKGSATSRSN